MNQTKLLFKPLKNQLNKIGLSFMVTAGLFSTSLSGQISYSFTAAGATGNTGPTQTQLNTAYAATNLNGLVTGAAGVQSWTVPSSAMYRIDVAGASGGGATDVSNFRTGGLGARMQGDLSLNGGDVVKIVVGQRGTDSFGAGSGGGGTYVVVNGVALIVAGGGGGASNTTNGVNAVTVTAGTSDFPASTNPPGTNGNGGGACNGQFSSSYNGGGGGGFNLGSSGNGVTPNSGGGGGLSFLNGSTGGTGNEVGGFGGGGGAKVTTVGGGGGGGYSGGVGGDLSTGECGTNGPQTAGGGGGSINTGVNQLNSAGTNTGNGFAVITSLCNVNITATNTLICSGNSVTLTTSAISGYNWSTGNTTSSVIVVSPTSNTTYTVGGTGTIPSGCAGSAAITITVNNTPTVTIASSTLTACLGQTVSLTATGANTYVWTGSTPTVTNGVAFAPAATTSYSVTGTNACGTSSAAVTVTVNVLPVLASASSTIVCASTPATLMAGGATTYTWMPGNSTQTNYIASPAANTVYTVTGKVGSCLGTNTVAITTKPNPTITIAASNATICNGGTAVLTAGGAVTYTWNPVGSSNTMITVSPTLSTLYTVVGTNAVNCNASASQVILVNAKPVINVSATDLVVCPGGGSTLTATGASTYLWDGTTAGATLVVHPVVTTTYAVVGTGTNTCSNATMITVGVFDPSLTVSGSTAVCRGTNVNLSASGMDTYQWSTGSGFSSINVTPTITTTYSVNTTSTQGAVTCSVSGAVTVSVNANPTVTAASNATIICKGETAVITASGAVTYTWSGSTPEVAAAITVTPSADQTYTVAGQDANGCKGSGTTLLRVAGCVGITNNTLNENNLSIYPNPSNGDFTISSDQTIDLKITNELGQDVRTISLSNSNKEIKVSNLASGIYFITGKNEYGSVKQKIIITR